MYTFQCLQQCHFTKLSRDQSRTVQLKSVTITTGNINKPINHTVTTFPPLHQKLMNGVVTRDVHGYPVNELSEYIRIVNYPFNYPSTWRISLFVYFLCSFQNFYAILEKF